MRTSQTFKIKFSNLKFKNVYFYIIVGDIHTQNKLGLGLGMKPKTHTQIYLVLGMGFRFHTQA